MSKNIITLNNKNYIKDDTTLEYTRHNPLLDIRIKYLKKQLKKARLMRLIVICVFGIFIVLNLIKGNYFFVTVSFLYMILSLALSANYIKSLSDDLRYEQSKITKFRVIK